jgi:hypothetical protein
MAIPHASAPYPNLSRVVTLPTPAPRAQTRDRAERRAQRQRRAGSA